MPFGILGLILQIALAVHAARTGRMSPWLWIILFIPGIGGLIYVIVEVIPDLWGGRTSQKVQSGIVKAVDPGRNYRALLRAVEISPTVHNQLRLAEECLRLRRIDEAVVLYEACASGLHATEPGIRLGLAKAYFEAGDFPRTIAVLNAIKRDTPEHRSADGHLLYARALEGAGRMDEALEEYEALAGYYSGEEARCRYADLLARQGAADAAKAEYREIVRRVDLQGRRYRTAQRPWYDAARRASA